MIHELDQGQELKFNPDYPAITDPEHRYVFFQGLEESMKNRYKIQREAEYPQITEYIDAWVKDDLVGLETYKEKCLAVKTKYPKPL